MAEMKARIVELIQQQIIRLGMTRADLLFLLGEPHDKAMPTRSMPQPLIWKYGEIEFHWGPKDYGLWLVIEAENSEHHVTLLQ